MKNTTLAMLTLFTALSTATMSSAIYADDTDKVSCSSCGCGSHKHIDENRVHRERVNPNTDNQGSVKEQN